MLWLETLTVQFQSIQLAVNLVLKGARLIGTNPDVMALLRMDRSIYKSTDSPDRDSYR